MVDWARDILRSSLISQLRCLASGRSFDQISVWPDSDIISKRKAVSEWASAIPSIVTPVSVAGDRDELPSQLQSGTGDSSFSLPNTKLGVVRLLSTVKFRLIGLRVTDGNIDCLFETHDGPDRAKQMKECARDLLQRFKIFGEVMSICGADLDHIEHQWAGNEPAMHDPFDEGPGAEFYAVFEYRCFMDERWEIIRELSYWAVSKHAFAQLQKIATYPMEDFEPLLGTSRPCSDGTAIQEMLVCLKSGSPWQILFSAITCVLLSICPKPEIKREDGLRKDETAPVEYLAFENSEQSHIMRCTKDYLSNHIMSYLKGISQEVRCPSPGSQRHLDETPTSKKRKTTIGTSRRWEINRSFCRIAHLTRDLPEDHHDASSCARCQRVKVDFYAEKAWKGGATPSPTAYGAILVASLKEECSKVGMYEKRHDLSLFVIGEPSWLLDNASVSTIVEDLLQNGLMYHTILHNPSKSFELYPAILWNLPCPYRKSTRNQLRDVANWIKELDGHHSMIVPPPKYATPLWVHQQIMLHFLRMNLSYEDSLQALVAYRDKMLKADDAEWRRGDTLTSLKSGSLPTGVEAVEDLFVRPKPSSGCAQM